MGRDRVSEAERSSALLQADRAKTISLRLMV
jgi:hypothetical protein